jgi:N12 class adenine-specific DNA methylase
VVTDVLILRKRARALRESEADWIEVGDINLSNDEGEEQALSVNALYVAHPERMLGRPAFGRGMYEAEEFLLYDDGRNLAESLAETLITQLPADGYRAHADSSAIEVVCVVSDRDDFLAAANSGSLSERDRDCVNQLLEIYLAAKEVIRLQLRDASDEELKAKQRELSDLYAGFKLRFGPINGNVKKLDPRSPVVPFLKALEIPAGKNLYNRAPIFSERTIRPARIQSGDCSPKEALLISLNDKGRVDLDYIVRLCRRPYSEALAELGALVYETPSGEFVTAEEYLSGDVRQKLREAERAAEFNPAFQKNVEALRAVQPADLGRDEIIVRLGAAWVPESVVSEFIISLVPSFSGTVRYIPALAVWKIENTSAWARSSVEANQTWGTSRVNAFELIEDILNGLEPPAKTGAGSKAV